MHLKCTYVIEQKYVSYLGVQDATIRHNKSLISQQEIEARSKAKLILGFVT